MRRTYGDGDGGVTEENRSTRLAARPRPAPRRWLAVLLLSSGACSGDGRPASSAGPFAVASTIQVGEAPHGIRFSAQGDTAYVALSGEGRIAVVDLTADASPSDRVVAKWEAGETPLDLIQIEDGWLVSQFRDSILITLDLEGRIVPDDVWGVGSGPSLFTPSVVRGQTWITTEFSDRLWSVDVRAGSTSGFFETGDRPYPADVMWDGSHAFVPNLDEGTVSVIDLLGSGNDATIEVCPGPPGGALTADHVTYIVACGDSDEVAFINTASFDITGRIEEGLGPRPFSVATPESGRWAVVNNAGGSTVSVLDLREGVVAQQLEVGEQPIVVRVHPDGERVFVANEVSGTLVELVPVDDVSASGDGPPEAEPPPPAAGARAIAGSDAPNEVVVLGMIHGEHETSERYGLEFVRELVREIDPDYWLTEIPPNRWERAHRDYEETGAVEEPRVRRFPEYVDGLFPLSRELDFEAIPTAGWTQPMSDARAAHLDALSRDPDRAGDWAAYEAANAAADSAIRAGGAPDDPRWIHTEAYDAAYEIRLSTYDRLFNEELGPGGWDNINRSHWANIERALDEHRGEGARFLITYGAGHKGWFLRKLRARDDIVLLDVAGFLDRIENSVSSRATADPVAPS